MPPPSVTNDILDFTYNICVRMYMFLTFLGGDRGWNVVGLPRTYKA